MLNVIANWASIIGVALAFVAVGYARRTVLRHMRTHIAITRNWVLGPAMTGWNPAGVSPRTALAWRHPRNHQVPLFSAGALSEVTLLQNVFIPGSLIEHLALVAQSIEAFNDMIAQYNAFKMRDPVLYVRVEHKLDAAAAAKFPQGVPDNMTQADLAHILATANFTPDEAAWCETLFHILMHAHVTFIGGATGGPGLFRRLQDLETEFATRVG